MDQEEMEKELKRILGILSKIDPTTEKYKVGIMNYHELAKTFHEELESSESHLDHCCKREIDELRLDQDKIEEENRKDQAKKERLVNFIKHVLSLLSLGGGIALTVFLEQSSIISQKAFSLAKILFPKN